MKLLLLSNSTIPGQNYLEWAREYIKDYYGPNVKNIAFVPYAGVSISWDDYEKKVQDVFSELGYNVFSVHHEKNPIDALNKADGVAVGGGNTFKLVSDLYETGLMQAIREKVQGGMPFSGWSAGSNVACPTIRTTNDMPIVQPPSFDVLNFVPFQINPHYLDANPKDHGGETRQMRIEEFLELNQQTTVIGLREGTLLRVEGNEMVMQGERNARIFKYGQEPVELTNKDDFSKFLR